MQFRLLLFCLLIVEKQTLLFKSNLQHSSFRGQHSRFHKLLSRIRRSYSSIRTPHSRFQPPYSKIHQFHTIHIDISATKATS